MGELVKCTAKTVEETLQQLTSFSAGLMKSLPSYIQESLVLDRQSNGVVQLSQVQTEQLMADMVGEELKRRKNTGDEHPALVSKRRAYKGSFSPVCQFVGYQARTSMPSNFDSEYGRALGGTAAMLASCSTGNGYMASVSGLAGPVDSWRCAGVPISSISSSTDEGVRVVPARVPLQGPAWQAWKHIRNKCATEDLYNNPGPIQLSGCGCDSVTETLRLRASQWGAEKSYMSTLEDLRAKLDMLRT